MSSGVPSTHSECGRTLPALDHPFDPVRGLKNWDEDVRRHGYSSTRWHGNPGVLSTVVGTGSARSCSLHSRHPSPSVIPPPVGTFDRPTRLESRTDGRGEGCRYRSMDM